MVSFDWFLFVCILSYEHSAVIVKITLQGGDQFAHISTAFVDVWQHQKEALRGKYIRETKTALNKYLGCLFKLCSGCTALAQLTSLIPEVECLWT